MPSSRSQETNKQVNDPLRATQSSQEKTMATSAITHPLPAATGFAHTLRIFRTETNYEFLKLMRTKAFSLATIELAKMLGMTIAGSISFASMGLLLALLVPANAAPGIVNLIYLPMSFLSGLWIPIRFMPHWLQSFAPALPTYHLAQLMLSIFGYGDSISLATHWNALIGFTLLMLGLSWLIFHRKEQNA